MSHSHPVLPTKPISLPYSHFFTSPIAPYAPTLRIKIIPHLLIQSPPLSPSVIGRKLEGCTEVVMPVGGKVPITLTVDKDVLGDIGVGEGIEGRVRDLFMYNFKVNHSALGLSPLEPVIDPPSTSVVTSKFTTLILNPLTACPTKNVLFKNLIPSASPIAFLTGVDIFYEWVVNRPNSPIKRNQQLQEDQGQEDQEHDEDILFIHELDIVHGASSQYNNSTSQGVQARDLVVTPQLDIHNNWLLTQVRSSIDRLIREQFIRRFPLIFDGGLLSYSSTLHIPRGIPSALTHLLHLSNMYNTPLRQEMNQLLKPISLHQEEKLYSMVRGGSELQARRGKRKSIPQSQIQSQGEQGPSYPSKKKRQSDSPEVEFMDPSDRCHAYLEQVMHKRREWDGEGSNKTEKKLKRIIGDVLGQIGRSNFEYRRRKPGKMSYNKIKLVSNGTEISKENTSFSTAQPHIKVGNPFSIPQSYPEIDKVGDTESIAAYSSGNELLIDQEDEYQPYEEDDELLLEGPPCHDGLIGQEDENDDDKDLLLIEEDFGDQEDEEKELGLLIDKDRAEEAELMKEEKTMGLSPEQVPTSHDYHHEKYHQNGQFPFIQFNKSHATIDHELRRPLLHMDHTVPQCVDGEDSENQLLIDKDQYDHLPMSHGQIWGTCSFQAGEDVGESDDELLI
ncbi:uncharacterized protein L199_006296 [Kwoniella botswanensis]|uniref:uncharacterized protein n=1 Tax=Kwoniella botswanensis TaxID=1268659 RepID=UPI00315C72E9